MEDLQEMRAAENELEERVQDLQEKQKLALQKINDQYLQEGTMQGRIDNDDLSSQGSTERIDLNHHSNYNFTQYQFV